VMLEFLKRLFRRRPASAPTDAEPRRAALAGQHQTETGLRQSEEHFERLVAGVRDHAIFLLNRQGNILTWNAGAERIKGYAPGEIIGQHFSRFYPPEDVERG